MGRASGAPATVIGFCGEGAGLYDDGIVGGSVAWRKLSVFAVRVTQEERGTVFALCGELDFDSMVQLDEAGERELAKGPGAGPVVADCTRLTFCDSSGISAFLRLFQQLAAQDRVLRLAAVPASVARVFSVTGLDRVFIVHADAVEALEGGGRGRGIVTPGTDGEAQPKERQII
ncbi:STAS domain-containing protein [Streptomyces sp. NPDC001073]